MTLRFLNKGICLLFIYTIGGSVLSGCGAHPENDGRVKRVKKPKCMKSARFFKGESQGSTRKQALNDAIAEVTRQVKSKVESEVKSNCTSRSSQGFKCNESVNVVVKSDFKYGELIKTKVGKSKGQFKAYACLDPREVARRVKEDHQHLVGTLSVTFKELLVPQIKPSKFTQLWSTVRPKIDSLTQYLASYHSVSRKKDPLNKMLQKVLQRRVKILNQMPVYIRANAVDKADISGEAVELIQSLLNQKQISVARGNTCNSSGVLLDVHLKIDEGIYSLTGTTSYTLKWGMKVKQCKGTPLGRGTLPKILAVERSNRSASQSMSQTFSDLIIRSQNDQHKLSKRQDQTYQKINQNLQNLFESVLPL